MAEERVRNGVDWEKEAAADWILARGRDGVTKHSEKKNYLSPSQLERRKEKEVLLPSGTPDRDLRPGLFKRAYNPTIGKKPHYQSEDN